MIEDIMQIDNPEKLKQLEDFLDELCEPPGKPPCQYTLEELRRNVLLAEEQIKNGQYYTWDEIKAEWEEAI